MWKIKSVTWQAKTTQTTERCFGKIISNVFFFRLSQPIQADQLPNIFPSCEVRVVRSYVCWPPLLILLVPLLPPRTSTSSRSQWSLPDPNSNSVSDYSPPDFGHRQTRTANSGSEWPPPHPNRKLKIRVVLAGQQQPLDQSVLGRKFPKKGCQNICPAHMPERIAIDSPD